MAVEDPGFLVVICDRCEESVGMETTTYAGSPDTWGVDDETLEAEGWTRQDGETYCPECSKSEESE